MSVLATELVLRTTFVSKPECLPTYVCTYMCISRGVLPTTVFSLKPEGLWGGACLHFADSVFSVLSSSLVMEL